MRRWCYVGMNMYMYVLLWPQTRPGMKFSCCSKPKEASSVFPIWSFLSVISSKWKWAVIVLCPPHRLLYVGCYIASLIYLAMSSKCQSHIDGVRILSETVCYVRTYIFGCSPHIYVSHWNTVKCNLMREIISVITAVEEPMDRTPPWSEDWYGLCQWTTQWTTVVITLTISHINLRTQQ